MASRNAELDFIINYDIKYRMGRWGGLGMYEPVFPIWLKQVMR